MSKDCVTILGYSIMVLGMLGQTWLTYYLKKDVSILKRWRFKREGKSVLVLMVDDNDDDLFIVEEKVLSKMDIRYETHEDGLKLVEGMTTEKCVVILDHYMPRLTGLDLVEKILQKNSFNKIISYTGLNDKQIAADYQDKTRIRVVYKDNADWELRLRKAINDSIDDILNDN